MASNFIAPTSPDADPNSGAFSTIVLTQGARIDVRYTDMSRDDYIYVDFGPGYITPQQQGNATGTVQFLIPAAEVLKMAGRPVLVTYTVYHPTGPSTSQPAVFAVPENLAQIAITQVLDRNNVLIPNGGTTTSTTVTVNGTVT